MHRFATHQARPASLSRCGHGAPGPRRQQGFTLLEVLIAVTVTAVIGVGVWQLLSSVIAAKNGIDRVSDEFVRLQQAVVVLERDLAQMVYRPVRDAYGETLPAVSSRIDPYLIEFTHTGWRNPLQTARSNLQRVAYEVVDETLIRYYWTVLDRAQDTLPREQVLLEDVTDMSWRFLDQKREWKQNWPTDAQAQSMPIGGGAEVMLPLAVELVIEHRRFGRIRRLVDVGDFDREQFGMQSSAGSVSDDGNEADGQATDSGNTEAAEEESAQ